MLRCCNVRWENCVWACACVTDATVLDGLYQAGCLKARLPRAQLAELVRHRYN